MPLAVEIVTPERRSYAKGNADIVVVPGVAGEMGFESDHIPLLTVTTIGEVRIHAAGRVEAIAVGRGIVEVSPEKVLVLSECAEEAGEINVDRATEARARAESRLDNAAPDIDVDRARNALARALNRLKVARGGS